MNFPSFTLPAWVFKHSTPKTEKLVESKYCTGSISENDVKLMVAARNDMAVNLGAGTSSNCISACQKYLPYAKFVANELASASARGFSHTKLPWTSGFTDAFAETMFTLTSPQQEVALVMTAEACSYRKEAWEAFAEMTDETDEAKIKIVNNRLCTAAGIYDALSKMPLDSLNTDDVEIFEFNTDVCAALSEVCIFEAEGVVIRNAATKMSPKVVQRLCADASARAAHAADLLARVVGKKANDNLRMTLLLRYCQLSKLIYRCSFGVIAARASLEEDKGGVALGFMRYAAPTSEERKLFKEGNLKKRMPSFLKAVIDGVAEFESVLAFVDGKNKMVYFDPVPAQEKLPVVEPVNISKLIVFTEPAPASVGVDKSGDCVYM